jgi:hypothetical protein
LENLDSEAGRRMEQLEQDLSFVKIGFTEELDKLHQELKSPQEKFEDRIGDLEDKLSKLNLEWGDSSEVMSTAPNRTSLKHYKHPSILYRS